MLVRQELGLCGTGTMGSYPLSIYVHSLSKSLIEGTPNGLFRSALSTLPCLPRMASLWHGWHESCSVSCPKSLRVHSTKSKLYRPPCTIANSSVETDVSCPATKVQHHRPGIGNPTHQVVPLTYCWNAIGTLSHTLQETVNTAMQGSLFRPSCTCAPHEEVSFLRLPHNLQPLLSP